MGQAFHWTVLALLLACPEGLRKAQRDHDTASDSSGSVGSYGFISRACVWDSNILLKPNSSLDECKRLCDQRSTCKSFEYGHNYGGAGYGRPGDCHLQSSSDPSECDGSYYNFDLHIKTSEVCVYGYRRIEGGCVDDRNLEMIHDSNVRECELRCSATPGCKSFEFGHNYGGSGYGRANDCQLQSGDDDSNCNGFQWNFDLYKRVGSCAQIPSFDASGEWVPLITIPPGGVQRSWTYGSSRTDGQELTSSVTIGLETSVSAGFTSASQTFEMSLSSTMSTSITSEVSETTVFTFEPSSQNGSNFLWQWYFYYEERGALFARTISQSFAMSSDRATPPRCLPGYFEDQFHGAQRCVSADHTINYHS